jgi:amino acid adenylation domain-containing protein
LSDAERTRFAETLGYLPASDSRPAIIEPGRGSISYADLDRLATGVAERLLQLGLASGSRVGLYLRRSTDVVAAMLGALRAGCSYVPVDPRAPADRIAAMHADCSVHATLVEDRFEESYRKAWRQYAHNPMIESITPVGLGNGIDHWIGSPVGNARRPSESGGSDTELACLLYTSGTTGLPKGWKMTRQAIAAHVSWSHQALGARDYDVFANHAQFSFGMSLFDIFASLGCGARLVIVPEEIRSHASRIVDLWCRERVSIWFSGPTILSSIGQVPNLETRDLTALRVVAFAGEVFPFPQLNTLREHLCHPSFFNFYGSTETNVAAYYELPREPLESPPPLGRPCDHYEARIVDSDGALVPPATIGELQLRGAGVSAGYWNQPRVTAEKTSPAADGGTPWFRTGDLVTQAPNGELRYAGRTGRMIKLRGYRIEPGEIETRLYQHPLIKEVGIVPMEASSGLELVAHVVTATGEPVPVVALKEFCSLALPPYMIPTRFEYHDRLPRTSSGKIDFASLGQAFV